MEFSKLNYRIDGPADAPWLTLAHSLATDMRMWEPQIAALSQHFRVLRFDARGHGASDHQTDTTSMSDLVDDVLRLWHSLNIAQSHFVGLSMGGMTGVGVALKAPEKVLSLVACDCRLDAPPFFRDMWDQRISAVRQQGMEGVLEQTLSTWFTPEKRAQNDRLIQQVSRMILETPVRGYLACADALKGLDYKGHLSELSVPTLFMVGEQDGPHPEEMKTLAEMTPNAQFQVLENAAHLSNMEQPDAFNRAVLTFLHKDPSSA
ncbi:alpha/beta fold hydrolase [Pseudomaricurvus alkylphenolicus]|uniref:alpha/beta fold hydrolase n=1 Tax=Pseudomaricurvus alkylphenolicus TaxID=1306991 RepID=UPI00141F57A8|nr:alpha/beta fold hydrolase [Pseudomaricurvus alkylphenolicus]